MFRFETPFMVIVILSCAGCASSGATPRPFPLPGVPPPSAPRPVATSGAVGGAYEVTGTALSLRGAPYRNGGSDLHGFDCSGFVWYVFTQNGIAIPRTVGEQYRFGTSVPGDALLPGDLVFFDTSGGASHVGLMIGGNEFIHAPSSRGEVRVERLSSSYWSQRLLGGRRVIRIGGT